MYNQIDADVFRRAGEFNLSSVLLVTYQSSTGLSSQPKKIDISKIIIEVSIFESIFDKTLSGAISILDAVNLLGFLPLTGYERLEFKLQTPSVGRVFDFTEETGHPVFIYKVSSRTTLNPRSQVYILHFISKEAIVNEQIRLYQAPKKQISDMVSEIVRDKKYLNSAKNIVVEETLGIHKYVYSSLKPFEAIDTLSREARSKRYYNAGMLFYETATGFNFRSLESMLAFDIDSARPSTARFTAQAANVRDDGGSKDIAKDMSVIRNFKILSQFDTLKNLRNGVYASKLITHDNLNKRFYNFDFNYNTDFELAHHTENAADGSRTADRSILPILQFTPDKKISDFYEGTQYFATHTENIHDDTQRVPLEYIIQKRLSQRLAFESFKIELELFGFTGLSAGDVVTLDIPSYAPYDQNYKSDTDPVASGRYLVTSLRHVLSFLNKTHFMFIQCLKDSVRRPYPQQNIDTFTNRELEERQVFTIKELDEAVVQLIKDDIFK
jgi:hypothetical protein